MNYKFIAVALLLLVANRNGVSAKRISNRRRNGKPNKTTRVLAKLGKGSKAKCEKMSPIAVYTATGIDGSVSCYEVPGFGKVGKSVDLFDASSDTVVGSLEYCIDSALYMFGKITTTHEQLFVMFLHDPTDGRMVTQLLADAMMGRKLEHDDEYDYDDDYYGFGNFQLPEVLPVKGSSETLGGRITMEGLLYDLPDFDSSDEYSGSSSYDGSFDGSGSMTMNPSSTGSFAHSKRNLEEYECDGDDCPYVDDDDDYYSYDDDDGFYLGYGYRKADLTFSFYGQLPEVDDDGDGEFPTEFPMAPPTPAPYSAPSSTPNTYYSP